MAQFAGIQDTLAYSADMLRDVTAHQKCVRVFVFEDIAILGQCNSFYPSAGVQCMAAPPKSASVQAQGFCQDLKPIPHRSQTSVKPLQSVVLRD